MSGFLAKPYSGPKPDVSEGEDRHTAHFMWATWSDGDGCDDEDPAMLGFFQAAGPKLVVQTIQASAGTRGRTMLAWASSQGMPVHVIEVVPETCSYFERMAGEGLVADWDPADGWTSPLYAASVPYGTTGTSADAVDDREPPFSSPGRRDVPADIQAWAAEWGALNAEVAEDGLLVCCPTRKWTPGSLSLYGGHAPIRPHVDVTAETEPDEIHPIWGLMLSCPEGRLCWDDGSVAVGTGSCFTVDPGRTHSLVAPAAPLAFVATWGYDPEAEFGSHEAFMEKAISFATQLFEEQPDPVSFLEKETGMQEGELR
jgi:hypothetical protein